MPKHYWEGTDTTATSATSRATTLEPPLGTGPYRIKEFDAGRTVVLRAGARIIGAKDIPT